MSCADETSSCTVTSALKVAPPEPTRADEGSGTAKSSTSAPKAPDCRRAASSASTAAACFSFEAVTTTIVVRREEEGAGGEKDSAMAGAPLGRRARRNFRSAREHEDRRR